MTELFLCVANMSISAGWLILAVIVLRFVLRKSPKWIFPALWGVVGIRLCIPLSFESVLSLVPSAKILDSKVLYGANPGISTGVESINNVVNPFISSAFPPNPATSANPLQIFVPIACVAWLAGVFIMISYFVGCSIGLKIRLSGSKRIEDGVFESAQVSSPFVVGFFRPRIILPENLSDGCEEYVLLHEKAHILRFDHITKPLGFIILAIHWFNPLVWVAYFLLCRDIEFACDERVAAKMPASQIADYSQALLVCSLGKNRLACPAAFCETGVKTRVKKLLSNKKYGKTAIFASVILIVAFAVLFLSNPPENTDISGKIYEIDGYLYDPTIYSFTYTPYSWESRYAIVPGKAFYMRNDLLSFGGSGQWKDQWRELCDFSEIKLTKENFDSLFFAGDSAGWHDGSENMEFYRKNNRKAWIAYEDRYFYCILLQKDGNVLLTGGYDTGEWVEARFLLKLKPSESKQGIYDVVVKGYDEENGVLFVDPVEFVSMSDEKRVIELGLDFNDMPNGYYIYNASEEYLPIYLSEKTGYRFYDWPLDFESDNRWVTTNSMRDFFRYLRTYDPYPGMPFIVCETDGFVSNIEERFVP